MNKKTLTRVSNLSRKELFEVKMTFAEFFKILDLSVNVGKMQADGFRLNVR